MTSHKNKDLPERIIEHLRLKKETGDDLDGIALAIYQNEMKGLSDSIINNLSDLIESGKIKEFCSKNGKRYYKLAETSNR